MELKVSDCEVHIKVPYKLKHYMPVGYMFMSRWILIAFYGPVLFGYCEIEDNALM